MNHFFIITNRDKDMDLSTTNEIKHFLQKKGKTCRMRPEEVHGTLSEAEASRTLEREIPAETECVIVLGGDAPGVGLLKACAAEADFSIAADRGLEAFDAAGMEPDMLIGDMDSVSPQVLARYESRLSADRLNCIKDDTDGEYALNLALEKGATEITLLGALGGRLDHALANLMMVVRAARHGAWAEIRAEGVCIVRVNGSCTLAGARGSTISLLPLGTARGVSIRGCYYLIDDYTLESDSSRGMSNVVTADEAVITVREGDLLLFHYSDIHGHGESA